MYIVKANRERPDFRVFIDLLYNSDRNVDTSGNCRHVSDRTWTDIYIRDRESDDPSVEAWIPNQYWEEDEAGNESCIEFIFYIKSDDPVIEEKFAIFFYLFCGEYIQKDKKNLDEIEISLLKDTHKVSIIRAEKSDFHNSNLENPYPNLSK